MWCWEATGGTGSRWSGSDSGRGAPRPYATVSRRRSISAPRSSAVPGVGASRGGLADHRSRRSPRRRARERQPSSTRLAHGLPIIGDARGVPGDDRCRRGRGAMGGRSEARVLPTTSTCTARSKARSRRRRPSIRHRSRARCARRWPTTCCPEHAAGDLRVTIGRSSDYFAAGGARLGDRRAAVLAAVAGRKTRWLGGRRRAPPEHFIDDIARGLVSASARDGRSRRRGLAPARGSTADRSRVPPQGLRRRRGRMRASAPTSVAMMATAGVFSAVDPRERRDDVPVGATLHDRRGEVRGGVQADAADTARGRDRTDPVAWFRERAFGPVRDEAGSVVRRGVRSPLRPRSSQSTHSVPDASMYPFTAVPIVGKNRSSPIRSHESERAQPVLPRPLHLGEREGDAGGIQLVEQLREHIGGGRVDIGDRFRRHDHPRDRFRGGGEMLPHLTPEERRVREEQRRVEAVEQQARDRRGLRVTIRIVIPLQLVDTTRVASCGRHARRTKSTSESTDRDEDAGAAPPTRRHRGRPPPTARTRYGSSSRAARSRPHRSAARRLRSRPRPEHRLRQVSQQAGSRDRA